MVDIFTGFVGLAALGTFLHHRKQVEETYSTTKHDKNQAMINQGSTQTQDLKLERKSDQSKREEALQEMAREYSIFPGHSRPTRPFRRAKLKQRREVEYDHSEPLVQNARQTETKIPPRVRVPVRPPDLFDAKGQMIQSFSTGMEAPGHIARSERMAELKVENRQAIAHRVLMPKTQKMGEAFPGRILALNTAAQAKQGVNIQTAPKDTISRTFTSTTRTQLQGQFPRPMTLPEHIDKAIREQTLQDFRAEVPGGFWKAPMQRNFVILKKPDRKNLDHDFRRPNPVNNQTQPIQNKDDPWRSLETRETLKKNDQTMQETKARYYAYPNQNQRYFNHEDSSRQPQRKIENAPPVTMVTATHREIQRPSQITLAAKGGTKQLTEHRDPQVQNVPVLVPSHHIATGAVERDGHRSTE